MAFQHPGIDGLDVTLILYAPRSATVQSAQVASAMGVGCSTLARALAAVDHDQVVMPSLAHASAREY